MPNKEYRKIAVIFGGLALLSLWGGELLGLGLLLGCLPFLFDDEELVNNEPEELVNNHFQKTTLKLASKIARLPVPDLIEFKRETSTLEYLDDQLKDCGWFETLKVLEEIDPLFGLKDMTHDYYSSGDKKYYIPVYTTDSVWLNEPTINTMITGVKTANQ